MRRTSTGTPVPGVWPILVLFLSAFVRLAKAQTANSTSANSYNVTSLPALITLNGSNTSATSTTTLVIPGSETDTTYVTLNLCSLASSDSTYSPSIWLTNSSTIAELGISTVLNYIQTSKRPSALWQKDTSTGMVQSSRYNQMIAVNANDVQKVLDGSSDGLEQQMGKDGTAIIWQLQTWNGFKNWTGIGIEGIWLEVDTLRDGMDIEVGVDGDGPVHVVSTLPGMLGDTTATQSLILSPVVGDINITQPTYPDYRISSPYPLNASIPSNPTSMRIVIIPTDESPNIETDTTMSLGNSMCAVLRAENMTGSLAHNRASTSDQGARTTITLQQRPEGWRWAFVTGTLIADTNYTAWLVEDGTGTYADLRDRGEMWQPIMLRTKEEAFPCPLAHSLALCPSIAYAAAIDGDNSSNNLTYAVTDIPPSVSETLTSSLNAFSSSLLAQACGRDLFSPVWTCQDCFDEYREWLCRTVIPQCASGVDNPSTSTAQKTITRTPEAPSAGHVSAPSYVYTQLLPCLSNCRRVDRKCPVNLQFRCPLRGKTANMTYAYDGKDKEDRGMGEGEDDGGIDEWGNRWCNGGLPG